MHDRDRVVRVQCDRAEADREGPAIPQTSFLIRGQFLVIGEHEGRIGRQSSLSDILAAFPQGDERRA